MFLVVADCLRSFGSHKDEDFPKSAGLRISLRDSVTYSRCVSAAPWTIPSHASLLTGLYPWQHNAHARANQALDPTFETLQRVLRRSGYRTVCLSGNPVLNSRSGLLRDFDVAETARWWEPYARRAGVRVHGGDLGESRIGPIRGSLSAPGAGLSRAIRVGLEAVHGFPALLDVAERLYQKIDGASVWDPTVCPWIESRLVEALRETPHDTPLFVLINLMDAHEPYLTPEHTVAFTREWWRLSTTPQRSSVYAQGRRTSSARERSILETLYAEATTRLENRIVRLVQALREANRWEGSLFILTSDHGQALLEHGLLFHGYKIDEPLVRVPLVVRFPARQGTEARCDEWASSVDVLPTVERTLGLESQVNRPGRALDQIMHGERREPVFTVGDGMLSRSNVSDWRTRSMRARLDVMAVGAYRGAYKLVVEESGRVPKVFEIQADPMETTDVWNPDRRDLLELQRAAEVVRSSLLAHRTSISSPDQSQAARLDGWGYV